MKSQKTLLFKLPMAGAFLTSALSVLSLSILASAAFAQQPSASPAPQKPSDGTQKASDGTTHFLSKLRLLNRVVAQGLGDSYNFAFAGDAAVKQGNWKDAQGDYQDALDIIPNNMPALYGMARCAEHSGDTTAALKYYRLDVYSPDPSRYGTVPGDGFQENDVSKLMHYAILLSRTGQGQEAVKIYNRAAYGLSYSWGNYDGGKPFLKVVLPEFSLGESLPDKVGYTPEHLQALADAALTHEELSFGSYKEAVVHMQEAVKLYPDSAVTNYYLGEALDANYYHGGAYLPEDLAGAKAAYQKAVQIGDDVTVAAAKERLAMYR